MTTFKRSFHIQKLARALNRGYLMSICSLCNMVALSCCLQEGIRIHVQLMSLGTAHRLKEYQTFSLWADSSTTALDWEQTQTEAPLSLYICVLSKQTKT